jgi:N-acetylmuramoyl-L-alanine amidase
MRFLFDPGHGGLINNVYQTPGKRSPKWPDGTQLFEGVYNREIVQILLRKCKEYGIEAIDIVNTNKDIGLKSRVNRANRLYTKDKTSVLISVHCNAASSESAHGSETFIYRHASNRSKKLANTLHNAYIKGVGLRDRGVKTSGFFILKYTNCPAVLIELGFMTNYNECQFLLNNKELVADSVFQGLLEFYNNNTPNKDIKKIDRPTC